MAKTLVVRFRVSNQEIAIIKNNATAHGCPTISAFIRTVALRNELWLEQKVRETNSLVREIFTIIKKQY